MGYRAMGYRHLVTDYRHREVADLASATRA